MSEEVNSGLIQDIRELEPRAMQASSADPSRRGGDSDGTDGRDTDGTDDGGDADGTDGDSDGTDSGDSDGTDRA